MQALAQACAVKSTCMHMHLSRSKKSIKESYCQVEGLLPPSLEISSTLITMSMISYHASGHPFTLAIAKWYVEYCTQVLASASPLLKKGKGLAYQSPLILK